MRQVLKFRMNLYESTKVVKEGAYNKTDYQKRM